MEHSKAFLFISWALRVIAAVILLQTFFFKFTGAKESVYIFSTLGIEPWGRIGSGVVELVASVLILAPPTVAWGALLSLAVISGAIISHLTKLGVALPAVDDHGECSRLRSSCSCARWSCSALHRQQLAISEEGMNMKF